jgi:GNAT superfamily N-acetyltransferase
MSEAEARGYSAAEKLKGGTAVTVRATRPGDRRRLGEAFAKLEPGSVYTRFFSHRGQPSDEELRAAVEVDFESVVALVVTVPTGEGDETIVGAGRYVLHGPPGAGGGAEVAFTVEEDYQGQGMAGMLLRHLAIIARRQGVSELTAEVLPVNRGMLAVFSRSGLPMQQRSEDGVVHVALTLTSPPDPPFARGERGGLGTKEGS